MAEIHPSCTFFEDLVTVSLKKAPLSWTVSVIANLNWLAFTNVSLSASRAASWALNVELQCKNGPLKVLPDSWARRVARFVEFGLGLPK